MHGPELDVDCSMPKQEGASEMIEESHPKKKSNVRYKRCGDLWKKIVEKSNQSGAVLTEYDLEELRLASKSVRMKKNWANKKFKLMTEEAKHCKEEAKHCKEEKGRMEEAEDLEEKAANLDDKLRKLSQSLDKLEQDRLLIADTMSKKEKRNVIYVKHCDPWKDIVAKSEQIGAVLTDEDLKKLRLAVKSVEMKKYRVNKEFKRITEEAKHRKKADGRMEEVPELEKKGANFDDKLGRLRKSLDELGEDRRLIARTISKEKKRRNKVLWKEVRYRKCGYLWKDIVAKNKQSGALLTKNDLDEMRRVRELKVKANNLRHKKLKQLREAKLLEKKEAEFDYREKNLIKELQQLQQDLLVIFYTLELDRMKKKIKLHPMEKKLNQMEECEAREEKAAELEARIQNRVNVEQLMITSDPEMNAGMSGVNQMVENLNEEDRQQLQENDNKEDGIVADNPATIEDWIFIEEDWIFIDDFVKEFETNANPQTRSALNDCVVQCASISSADLNI